MDSFRFRPQVSSLEDRLTPAASAQELIFQSTHAAGDLQFMQDFMATGTRPRSIATLSTLAVQLAGITERSAENAFEYVEALQGLQTAYVTNPAAVPNFVPVATWLLQNASRSHINTVLGSVLLSNVNGAIAGQGGTVPPDALLPAPPAPPPPPPSNDEFDSPPLVTAIPALDDPRWQPLGNQGLRTLDVFEGGGEQVQAGDTIQANYIGFLENGTVFDSSTDESAPPTFSLAGGVIQGWQQAIPGMRVGGVRRLDIPAELAYGATGQGSIPPNSRLIFEVKVQDTERGTGSSNDGTLTQEQIQELLKQQS